MTRRDSEPEVARSHTPETKQPGFDNEKLSVKCDCGGDSSGQRRNLVNTNVVELYSRLVKSSDRQVTYYNSGIGTYARPSWKSWSYIRQVVGHKIDLAIAWRFEKTLLDAYRWLSEMYEPGDRIFLFGVMHNCIVVTDSDMYQAQLSPEGFSRGAYQVRALSGMIEIVGLIHRGNQAQIPFAYELYTHCNPEIYQEAKDADARRTGYTVEKLTPERKMKGKDPSKMALRFKKTFSRDDVKIHFLGAWDTVSSIGLVRKDKNLPLAADGMKHLCCFRHALALDERRVKFAPEFAYGGATLPTSEHRATKAQSSRDSSSWAPQTKEVWFTGTHSDIGGGSTVNTDLDAYKISLRWMVRDAIFAGLLVQPLRGTLPIEKVASIHESLTGIWWLLEVLPIKRLSYKTRDSVTRWPHNGVPRQVTDGQLIHLSVRRLYQEGKLVASRLPAAWNAELRIEPDLLDQAALHLRALARDFIPIPSGNFVEPTDTSETLKTLQALSLSPEGRITLAQLNSDSPHLLMDVLDNLPKNAKVEALDQKKIAISIASTLLNFATEILEKRPESELPEVLRTIRRDSPNDPEASSTIQRFCQAFFPQEAPAAQFSDEMPIQSRS